MLKVLHIIPHAKIYPPKGGGMLRCFHIMDQLRKFTELDVISYQDRHEFSQQGYDWQNITFYTPKDVMNNEGLFKFFPKKIGVALKYRLIIRSFKGSAQKAVLDFYPLLKYLKRKKTYDFIIFEHTFSMMLSPVARRFWPKVKLILNAHNIDHKLMLNKKDYQHHLRIESTLHKKVDGFWACSESDTKELEELNDNKIKGATIPNGVDTNKKQFDSLKNGKENRLIFCGSLNYPPNKEGLIWFLEKVWPMVTEKVPSAKLTIIGRGNLEPYNKYKIDSRINLIGEVENVDPYYFSNYIAIVPLLSGSGTRLKILEAMSFGNPVVTTVKGIEGINAQQQIHALIGDGTEKFAENIYRIIENFSFSEKIRTQARKFVELRYDWSTIGLDINRNLMKYFKN